MIRRVQALNYRCLRSVDIELDRFQVLVGPNGSGKSTLLDVVGFLGDMLSHGLEHAVESRSRNFQDLVWGRPRNGLGFELAIELDLPSGIMERLPEERGFERFRYEVSIREDARNGVVIESERGLLAPRPTEGPAQPVLRFPDPPEAPPTILLGGGRQGSRTVLSKSPEGRDSLHSEVSKKPGKGWAISISFGPERSTLGNLPESPEKFPASTYVKRLLETGVNRLFLRSDRMGLPSPPGHSRDVLEHDGANLARLVRRLREEHRERFDDWLRHVRTALPLVRDVRVEDRPEDRHCCLIVRYETDVEVPSWMLSDGTLRVLALTLPAYLPGSAQIYSIEEPEDGLHPGVMQDVYDALSSVYDAQVLMATHSPILLSCADLERVLCFGMQSGATHAIPAVHHPSLRDWRGDPDLSVFFAAGVLG